MSETVRHLLSEAESDFRRAHRLAFLADDAFTDSAYPFTLNEYREAVGMLVSDLEIVNRRLVEHFEKLWTAAHAEPVRCRRPDVEEAAR